MKNHNEFELIPGNPGQLLFTPEEHEKFREWWQETVVPLIDAQPKSFRFFPD